MKTKFKFRFLPWISISLVVACTSAFAAVPVLEHPGPGATVYQTIPYFDWNEVVPYPYPGQYEIQISTNAAFATIFDEDVIPAFLSWYSPTVEFERGLTYYWRVRYVQENGVPLSWAEPESFNVGVPHYMDVLTTDGFDEIRAKAHAAFSFGATNVQAAELRFPENHTLYLSPTSSHLMDPPNDTGNVIINGRGCTLIMDQPVGLAYMRRNFDVQIQNLTIDFTKDALGHFGGVISNLDLTNKTFTVTVDPNVYGEGTFDRKKDENQARLIKGNDRGIGPFNLVETWAEARDGNQYHFTATGSKWGSFCDKVVENGDYVVSYEGRHGGDIVHHYALCDNILVNNLKTGSCGSRAYIVKHPTSNFIRLLNSSFDRSEGRILASNTGGLNVKGSQMWIEGNYFGPCTDDTYHAGGDGVTNSVEVTYRNNTIYGGTRSSVWAHSDRHWIAGNTISYGEFQLGNQLGSGGLLIDVGLVEDNTLIGSGRSASYVYSGYGSKGGWENTSDYSHHRYLTIRNNTMYNCMVDQAYMFNFLENSTVSNNVVISTVAEWDPYSNPEKRIAFQFEDCVNVSGGGNVVCDNRIAETNLLLVSNPSNVTVEVSRGSCDGFWGFVYDHKLLEGRYGDDDGDTVANLYEYALGGDPTNAADKGYPIHFTLDGTNAVYVHPQRSDPDVGINYVVETTDNLVSNIWKAVALMETNPAGYASEFDAVTNHVSTLGKTNGFIRLKIECE